MTDSIPTRQLDGAALGKPYVAPSLDELGTIGAITAGPNNGTLDQLGGASGGYLVAQGTS